MLGYFLNIECYSQFIINNAHFGERYFVQRLLIVITLIIFSHSN